MTRDIIMAVFAIILIVLVVGAVIWLVRVY